jgi:hypothetical protein
MLKLPTDIPFSCRNDFEGVLLVVESSSEAIDVIEFPHLEEATEVPVQAVIVSLSWSTESASESESNEIWSDRLGVKSESSSL